MARKSAKFRDRGRTISKQQSTNAKRSSDLLIIHHLRPFSSAFTRSICTWSPHDVEKKAFSEQQKISLWMKMGMNLMRSDFVHTRHAKITDHMQGRIQYKTKEQREDKDCPHVHNRAEPSEQRPQHSSPRRTKGWVGPSSKERRSIAPFR